MEYKTDIDIAQGTTMLTADKIADELGVDVEHSGEMEAAFFKVDIIRQRLADVARAANNHIITFVQPEDFPDFLVQQLHVIPVALLPEAAEVVQVLPDLRRGNPHTLAQLFGGYACDVIIQQIPQITVITGEPFDDRQ